jgi:hypothetical protein
VKVFNFFGLGIYPSTESFLETHTKHDEGNLFATTRNSTQIAFRWQGHLKLFPEIVEEIEEHCQEAMQLWGYLPVVYNKAGLTRNVLEDNVLTDPPWPEMTVPRENVTLYFLYT